MEENGVLPASLENDAEMKSDTQPSGDASSSAI